MIRNILRILRYPQITTPEKHLTQKGPHGTPSAFPRRMPEGNETVRFTEK